MDPGDNERATATPNTDYDLTSVIYHALESAATSEQYIRDAEQEGDSALVQFFRQVQEQDRNRAQQAFEFLGQRLVSGRPQSGGEASPRGHQPAPSGPGEPG